MAEDGIKKRLILRKIFKEVIEVNEFLKDKCRLNNIPFIENSNIKRNMLTSGGLHLNESGTARLANNFCYYVNQ